jgi:hypothetical protein
MRMYGLPIIPPRFTGFAAGVSVVVERDDSVPAPVADQQVFLDLAKSRLLQSPWPYSGSHSSEI